MPDFLNSPIFVLGLPRSGTSMVAGALSLCGAWTGTTVPGGGPINNKGFFEHQIIRDQITKQILTRLDCDPLGVSKIPSPNITGDIPELKNFIHTIITDDGYKNDRPWLYKDAKLTLIWPFYKNAFPDAKWVIVNRDEESFIDSCLRTSFMAGHSTDRNFWKNFSQDYLLRLENLRKSDAKVLEISAPEMIQGHFEAFKSLLSQLSLAYNEEKLLEFIAPSSWHNKSTQDQP